MKIKTKKQLNLPQLIEWAMENEITNTWFRASNVKEYISEVFFGATGLPQFSSTVNKNDLFTVEVEEEITEDTVIPKMLLVYASDDSHFIEDRSLGGLSKSCVEGIYILNDDLTLTLIWKDGKLVE